MAASKKSAKGNKTAHVLNLLTDPDSPREAAPGDDGAAAEPSTEQAAPAAPSSRPLLPPILEVAQSNDDNLAQQIQHALEEELEREPEVESAPPPAAELPAMEKAPAAPAVPAEDKQSEEELEKPPAAGAPIEAPEPKPAPAPSSPEANLGQEEMEKPLTAETPAEAPESVPEPAPEPVPAPEPEPPAAAAPAPEPPEEEDVTYTNVMQVLVEEKAPRYIEKFGLCTCKHCAADVKALALSNLVPKYVVLSKLDRIPMLTVYEGRYSTTIFAQLTRACKIVMDHPHHGRDE